MKKIISVFLLFVLLASPAWAAKSYLYRHRANWVKLEKLSNKQLAGHQLDHPYQGLNSEQMAAMLLTVTINKGEFLKSDKKTIQVFTPEEANKFAPFLVQALAQASPNQVVNMAVVHKRPYFILRNDLISIVNVFVQDSQLHLHFTKIYAKLEGDYKQASKLDRAVSKAKSVRVNLVTVPGQTLTADGKEVIMDLQHDFVADVEAMPEPEVQTKKSLFKKTKSADEPVAVVPATLDKGDAAVRLKKLEQLRVEKLITEAEYQAKKTKILDEL